MSRKKETVKEEKGITLTEKIAKHFEDPLLAVSVVVSLMAFFRGFVSTYFSVLFIVIKVLLAFISIYFIYLYFRSGKKNYYLFGIPIIIFLIVFFSLQATQSSYFIARDNTAFSIIFGIFLLLYAIALYDITTIETAVVIAIFLSSLVIHLVPALSYNWPNHPASLVAGKFLAEITDPYYYYRHANFLVNNNYLPEHETMVYPGKFMSFGGFRLMNSLSIGAFTIVLKNFGLTTLDLAILFPGVVSAFTSVVLYLLIKELFSDFSPYNKIAAFLAALMLIFAPAYGAKAIATNSEDDSLGMFFFTASFFLFIFSFRRKSFLLAIIAGFSFLMLNLTWSGYSYAVVVLGIFGVLYSIFNFIHGKNCIEIVPYIFIFFFISQLHPFILHPQGQMPKFSTLPFSEMISIGSAIFIPFILEFLSIVLLHREERNFEKEGKNFEEKLQNYLNRNSKSISALITLFAILILLTPSINPKLNFGISFPKAVNYVLDTIKAARTKAIIPQTTAEQTPLCDAIDFGCVNKLYNTFGISALFGLGMIPVLLYYAILKKKNFGTTFILALSLPLLWGVINKAQFQFAASVPIISLGSTIGLILAIKLKDFESLRIVPTITFFALILLLPFLNNSVFLLGSFGGEKPMYYGYNVEAVFWNPTLQWLRENTDKEKTEILTWWDYGHIITAVAERKSILDNVKGDALMVQDIAKFHVLIENETEALEVAKKYNATHVIIDWTMIGKSAAPHFIATSNVTAPLDAPNREGKKEGYAQCSFNPENSILKARPMPNTEGTFDLVQKVIFFCSLSGGHKDYIGAIEFEIKNKALSSIKVYPFVLKQGSIGLDTPIKWELWQKEHGGAILGVQSLNNILGNALNYNTDKYIGFPTFTNLIYVPKKFENYMMTKLYLADHLDEYKKFGLAENIEKSEHFELVDGFLGDKLDNSYLGYVKVYKIKYPDEFVENLTISNITTTF
ncbi:MAG: STT3 domain-containing protein [Candidatus Altiarchaeota archaeon]